MAYLGTTELKLYLGIGTATTTDDALLASLISAARGAVDAYCRRTFEATVQTRTYGMYDARVMGQKLYLDYDLQSVTQLVNGNEATIGGTGYWLGPQNYAPYGMIRLKTSFVWVWNTDGMISVTGTWGCATTAPDDIVQATKRLAGYFYRGKDSQTWDVTAFTEAGQLTIPKGLPADVEQLLRPYRRSQYS